MRRRPRLLAALGAGAVVAVCATVVGMSLATASARPAAAEVDGSTAIPQDMMWTWVQYCEQNSGVDIGDTGAWYSTDEDGVLLVQYGEVDEEGVMTVDEQLSDVIGRCVGSRRVLVDVRLGARLATPAERLEIYDWAVRWQRPCLAMHGYAADVQPPRDFLDQNSVPWYLIDHYLWTGRSGFAGIDFDALLEARLACPPVPPFLAAQGVGW